MNVDMDKYVRNFRIFYNKLVLGHPQQINLQKKFKFMLQNQSNKWRSGLFVHKSNQSSANSVKSFLSKAKSMQSNKANKIKYSWSIQTTSFSKAFVYACISEIIQMKSKEAFLILKENLQSKNVFIADKVFSGSTYRKVLFEWNKIQKIFNNPMNIKPLSVVAQAINSLCEQFTQLVFRSLTDQKIQPSVTINDAFLQQITKSVSLNIAYFQIQNNQIKFIKKIGKFKKCLNIGKVRDQNNFVVCKQLPTLIEEDVKKEKTIQKFSIISNSLFKLYQDGDLKLFNLESLSGGQSDLKSSNLKSSKIQRKNSISSSKRF